MQRRPGYLTQAELDVTKSGRILRCIGEGIEGRLPRFSKPHQWAGTDAEDTQNSGRPRLRPLFCVYGQIPSPSQPADWKSHTESTEVTKSAVRHHIRIERGHDVLDANDPPL